MTPALAPGDRLLCRRGARVRVGSLVVVAVSSDRSRWTDRRDTNAVFMVKRVRANVRGALDVRGDLAERSLDSRHLGTCPPQALVGVCVLLTK